MLLLIRQCAQKLRAQLCIFVEQLLHSLCSCNVLNRTCYQVKCSTCLNLQSATTQHPDLVAPTCCAHDQTSNLPCRQDKPSHQTDANLLWRKYMHLKDLVTDQDLSSEPWWQFASNTQIPACQRLSLAGQCLALLQIHMRCTAKVSHQTLCKWLKLQVIQIISSGTSIPAARKFIASSSLQACTALHS